ncbi:MAG: hypothetical protein C0467_25365 [Planctomycetaceae bacterium]|nr:hypothetical protein [Planctomycetaceae bacterium]
MYKPIPGHPGYRVGDDGSVWTCRGRTSIGKGRGRGSLAIITERWRPLKQCLMTSGRMMVTLSASRYRRFVHHLVLEAFVGPCPDGMEACHSPDRGPTNNRLENLRWDTKEANMEDRDKHGGTLRGERNTSAKLTSKVVRKIRSEYATGKVSLGHLARKHGVTRRSIRLAVDRQTWAHVS